MRRSIVSRLVLPMSVLLAASASSLSSTGLESSSTAAPTLVAATSETVLAHDDFERTVDGGWGSSAGGQAWTLSGDSRQPRVSRGAGRLVMSAAASQHAQLRGVSSSATRMTVEMSVDKLFQGTGEGFYLAATARQVGSDAYSARLVVGSDGAVRLHLLRNFVNLAGPVTVPGLTVQPGASYTLSVEAVGTAPTAVAAKVWRTGSAEPTSWQLKASDALPALQRAGFPGVFVYVPGRARNAPVEASFGSVRVVAPDSGAGGTTPAPPVTPAPPATGEETRGPVSYPSVAAMRASGRFNIPSDVNLVTWNHGNASLEQVLATLGSNDVLVLPERREPYVLDSSGGFRAAGVSAVLGEGGRRVPVTSTFQGRPARTWFAMARAQRGIIGLGPGAVIRPSSSSFRQGPQIEDKGSPLPGGGSSPGRFWYDQDGRQRYELVGSQEKLIESADARSYFGNFTLEGRDFGGVAYSAISTPGGTFERLDLDGAWRGFSSVPNGESAAISITGGRYLVSRVSMSPLDESGRRVGTSPLMINRSPGGRWEHGDVSQVRVGMPTIWGSSGRHELVDVTSRWGDAGINIENARDGFELAWRGGRIWPNRFGQGGHPSPDGIHGDSLHIALNASGRATVTLTDVDLDRNVEAGRLCVQLYGGTRAENVKVAATNGGRSVPVTLFGPGAPVRTG